MSLLSWLLVILAGLSLAATVVALSVANRSAREARTTIFPIVREEETVRARRGRIVSSVTGVIAVIMAGAFFISGQLPSPVALLQRKPVEVVAIPEPPTLEVETQVEPTDTPPSPSVEQATPTTSQVVPSITPPPVSDTQPLLPTDTLIPPTFTPTSAPSTTPTPVPPTPTRAETPIPAPASVQMGPIDFATQLTDRRQPISPTTVFSDTVNRVYATFPYSGMRNGLTWVQIWYYNGVEFSRGQDSWEWGSTDRSYVFTKLVGVGDYRLELYVNDDLIASGEFAVRGPIAVGGPGTPVGSATPENSETLSNPGTPDSPQDTTTPESP